MFISCTDNFDENMYKLGKKALYLLVSEDNIELTPESQAKKFVIETESPWTLEYDSDWLTIDKRTGSRGSVVTIKSKVNSTSDERSTIITIRTKDTQSFEKTIKVSQESFAVDMGTSVKWAPKSVEQWEEYNSSWSNWRYPTKSEAKELFDECTLKWTNGDLTNHSTICSANYVTVTSKNGNAIKIPTHRTDVNSIPNFRLSFLLYDLETECSVTSRGGIRFRSNNTPQSVFCTMLVCE